MNNKNFIFYTLAFLLAFLIIEIFLQGFYKIYNGSYLINRSYVPIYDESKESCWKVKPNLNIQHKTTEFNYNILTDHNSFRIVNESNKFDILSNKDKTLIFLGPSFSFGWGVSYEKSYANLIAEFFRDKNYKNFINASVPGQLPEMQLCWFIQEGYKYKPDIIIQTIYGNLDFNLPDVISQKKKCDEICKLSKMKVTSDGYLLSGSKKFSNPKFYIKNSAIIFYSWYYFSSLKSYLLKNNNKSEKFSKIQFENSEFMINKNLKNYKNYIDTVNFYSPKTKVIFIFIPFSFQIHKDDAPRWSHLPINLEKIETKYQIGINSIKNKYTMVDPTPFLKEQGKKERIYYYVDTHFNERGNEITFEVFKNFCNKTECYK